METNLIIEAFRNELRNAELTQELAERAVAVMREHNIPPSVIKTDKEAEELTTAAPFGKKWKVGDEYYPATKLGVDFAI